MNISAVTGGTVVTASGTVRADLLIGGGKVAAIGSAVAGADGRLDATGCYVLPGGVDPHTHLMAAPGPATAAAAGAAPRPRCPSPARGRVNATWTACSAAGRSYATAEYRLTSGCTPRSTIPTTSPPMSWPPLGARAQPRWKAPGLSGTRDHVLRPAVARADGHGRPVQPGRRRALRTLRSSQRWRTRPPRPASLIPGRGLSRAQGHPEAEEESVGRVLAAAAATGATCYLVHLSTAAAVRQVHATRGVTGLVTAHAEVCVHHLLLDDRCYDKPDAERYLVCPPLRARSDIGALYGPAWATRRSAPSGQTTASPGRRSVTGSLRPGTSTRTAWQGSGPGCHCCCQPRRRAA